MTNIAWDCLTGVWMGLDGESELWLVQISLSESGVGVGGWKRGEYSE